MARALVRAALADHKAAVLGVLWRPMHAAAIAKLTGLGVRDMPELLDELQHDGRVRPLADGLWERAA